MSRQVKAAEVQHLRDEEVMRALQWGEAKQWAKMEGNTKGSFTAQQLSAEIEAAEKTMQALRLQVCWCVTHFDTASRFGHGILEPSTP